MTSVELLARLAEPDALVPDEAGNGDADSDADADSDGGGDYAIPASSPAVSTGVSHDAVSGDFTGACFADPPSIGAFEAR